MYMYIYIYIYIHTYAYIDRYRDKILFVCAHVCILPLRRDERLAQPNNIYIYIIRMYIGTRIERVSP